MEKEKKKKSYFKYNHTDMLNTFSVFILESNGICIYFVTCLTSVRGQFLSGALRLLRVF